MTRPPAALPEMRAVLPPPSSAPFALFPPPAATRGHKLYAAASHDPFSTALTSPSRHPLHRPDPVSHLSPPNFVSPFAFPHAPNLAAPSAPAYVPDELAFPFPESPVRSLAALDFQNNIDHLRHVRSVMDVPDIQLVANQQQKHRHHPFQQHADPRLSELPASHNAAALTTPLSAIGDPHLKTATAHAFQLQHASRQARHAPHHCSSSPPRGPPSYAPPPRAQHATRPASKPLPSKSPPFSAHPHLAPPPAATGFAAAATMLQQRHLAAPAQSAPPDHAAKRPKLAADPRASPAHPPAQRRRAPHEAPPEGAARSPAPFAPPGAHAPVKMASAGVMGSFPLSALDAPHSRYGFGAPAVHAQFHKKQAAPPPYRFPFPALPAGGARTAAATALYLGKEGAAPCSPGGARAKLACPHPTCGKEYTRSHALNVHISTKHTGTSASYTCSACGKAFNRKDTLKRHFATTHQRLRNWPCKQCSRRFGQQAHLNTHVRTVHGKDRPHVCDQCPKSFGTLYNLNAHKNTHRRVQKAYACDTCRKTYKIKSSLARHRRKERHLPPAELAALDGSPGAAIEAPLRPHALDAAPPADPYGARGAR